MIGNRGNTWWVGLAIAGAALGIARGAQAHGEEGDREHAHAATATAGEAASSDAAAEAGDRDEKEEKSLELGIDMVVGFGKTNVANQDLPGGPTGVTPTASINGAQVTTESFIASASFEIAHHFDLGARIPFSFGSFSQAGRQSRGTSAFGNIELEAEWEKELNEKMSLAFGLGVALPTAQGDEVPGKVDDLNLNQGGFIDQTSYDRAAINRAAASSRGWEENALFEPKRLGIIPKIALEYHTGKLALEPYVKLENLISTSGQPDHKYIGEVVFGARLGYRVSKLFEPGVRAWGNVPFGSDSRPVVEALDKPVGIVEPEVRFHVGNVTPMVGVIIPFAGPLTDPMFVGVRAGLTAAF